MRYTPPKRYIKDIPTTEGDGTVIEVSLRYNQKTNRRGFVLSATSVVKDTDDDCVVRKYRHIMHTASKLVLPVKRFSQTKYYDYQPTPLDIHEVVSTFCNRTGITINKHGEEKCLA